MRYLTLGEVVDLHRRVLQATGGASGIRDFGVLESSVAQPKATLGGVELYPTRKWSIAQYLQLRYPAA
jgi:death-on-curing protein